MDGGTGGTGSVYISGYAVGSPHRRPATTETSGDSSPSRHKPSLAEAALEAVSPTAQRRTIAVEKTGEAASPPSRRRSTVAESMSEAASPPSRRRSTLADALAEAASPPSRRRPATGEASSEAAAASPPSGRRSPVPSEAASPPSRRRSLASEACGEALLSSPSRAKLTAVETELAAGDPSSPSLRRRSVVAETGSETASPVSRRRSTAIKATCEAASPTSSRRSSAVEAAVEAALQRKIANPSADVQAPVAVPEPAQEPPPESEPAPVQVCVRLRPLLGWEKADGLESSALDLANGARGSVTLRSREDTRKARSFRFDTVVGPEQSQADLWRLTGLERLVGKVLAGFHATVFAYGQTGSGKTHTMEGFSYEHFNGAAAPTAAAARPRVRPQDTPSDQLGVVPRAVETLFARLEELKADMQDPQEGAHVRVSFLQIYNEHIYDLLNPAHAPTARENGRGDDSAAGGLRLRWDASSQAFFVENLFSYECQTAEEVLKHYSSGVQCKQVASTAMNVASSRSHTVLVLSLVRRSGITDNPLEAGSSPVPMREVVSRLSLVDLAGSERASATSGCDRSAARFQEAVNVNQSLFVLRRVITALSKRSTGQVADARIHVPYRESKLTSLLQHAIGGNGFLLMLACLSPADKHFEENLSTLQYATQAADIKNEPMVNLDPKDRLIQELQARLAAAHSYILRFTGLSELPAELLEAKPAGCSRRTRCTSGSAWKPRRARSSERRAAPGTAPPAPPATAPATAAAPLLQATQAAAPAQRAAPQVHSPQTESVPAGLSTESSWFSQTPAKSQSARTITEGESLFAAADALLAGYDSTPAAAATATVAAGLHRQGGRCASPSSRPTFREDLKKNRRAPSMPPALPRAGLPVVTAGSRQRLSQCLAAYQGAPLVPSPRRSCAAKLQHQSQQPNAVAAVEQPAARAGDAQARGVEVLEDPTPSEALPSPSSSMWPRRSGSASPDRIAQALATTPEAAGDEASAAENRSESAMHGGLWDAIEELRGGKAELLKQLHAAEERRLELEAELDGLQGRVAAVAERGAASERVQAEALAAAEAEAASLRKERERLADENGGLQRERASLQQRLDVFFQALEQERPPSGGDPSARPALAQQVEGLHSRLVLEAVTLRNDVARLKKKKWVLSAVLAQGGESEQKAIDEELAQNRAARLSRSQQLRLQEDAEVAK